MRNISSLPWVYGMILMTYRLRALPNQFVLKCNHNSGTGMCICRDKSKLDIEKVKAELRKGLKENYFMKWREWPYKNVPRKILAEKFIGGYGTE